MKNRLIAGFLLLALICWAFPSTASGQTAVTIHEPHEVQEIKPALDESNSPRHQPILSKTARKNKKPVRVGANTQPLDNRNHESSGRDYSKEEVIQLIKDYSTQYGINAEVPLCIAKLESGYNQFSKNKSSSASGVFQYLLSTWKVTDEGKAGLSVFDAEANVKAAIKYMAIHKSIKPWVVAKNCPSLISQK